MDLTTIHPWCDGHSTSINACGVWGVRVGVQVSRRELHILYGSSPYNQSKHYTCLCINSYLTTEATNSKTTSHISNSRVSYKCYYCKSSSALFWSPASLPEGLLLCNECLLQPCFNPSSSSGLPFWSRKSILYRKLY